MGQRLVVTIKEDDSDDAIAKIYFHWSAYSTSALFEAKRIIDAFYSEEFEKIEDHKLRLIRICESLGGGIDQTETEVAAIQKMYPDEKFKSKGISRNEGLIALTEAGMNNIQEWSEGDIVIDFNTQVILNSVFSNYESLEEYNQDQLDCDEDFEIVASEKAEHYPLNLEEIFFSDLDNALKILENCQGIYVNDTDGTVYELIQ